MGLGQSESIDMWGKSDVVLAKTVNTNLSKKK